jgi:6-pyruvoyl-tetrahydropterin synthase
MGFVVDFGVLKREVLQPVHTLLDHGLALYEARVEEAYAHIKGLGEAFMGTRAETKRFYKANDGLPGQPSAGYAYLPETQSLNGARQQIIGGMKIAVFPFSPTSELLAEWLFGVAAMALEDGRVRVKEANVYETLHPVHAIASYSR